MSGIWAAREAKKRKFPIGTDIIWLHEPRGGYGYVFRIPGKVVGYGRGRIKIEVAKADGEKVQRFVKEESLRFGGL